MEKMRNPRAEKLVEKLSRGISKSLETFENIEPDQWKQPIFDEPESWNLKDLVAHFVYSEEYLFHIAQDIASGGQGFPEGIDINEFNKDQMEKWSHLSIDKLLVMLRDARQETIDWVIKLEDSDLDKIGSHPVLGDSNVETVIYSIYAHQLMHMRETAPKLRKTL
jgi:hypothetical protein